MPAASRYLEPNDLGRTKLGGDQERRDRETQYLGNKKFYEGKHPDWLVQDYDDPVNDNVKINVTKQAVDRTISFLFPDLPLFQLDLNQDTSDERWLNDVWLNNGGAFLLHIIGQNGALSGHNYVKIMPSDQYPRLMPINPCVPITFWQVDDPSTVVWHESKWTVGNEDILQDVINFGDHWEIHEYRKATKSKVWAEDASKYVTWGSRIGPIVAWPHIPNPNQYYGLPEITDETMELNNTINRVASDVGKILRYHASPRTVAIGVTQADIIPGEINGLYTIANENAQIMNLEMQSDLGSSLAYLNYLNDAFLTLKRVVVMKGTVKDFQRVTNTGIQAVFIDMLAKNALLRWTYGAGLQKLSQALLFVDHKNNSILPTVTWPDPLPSDPLETVNKYTIEQANGWNNPKSISQALGYEWGVNVKNWQEAIKYEWIGAGQASRLAKAPNSDSSQNNVNP